MKRILISLFVAAMVASAMPAQAALSTAEITARIAILQAQLTGNQASTASTTWCHTFTKNIKIDDTSGEVGYLQDAFQKEGFTISSAETETNVFGEETAAAVVSFQQKYGIQATGFVGSATRSKLNALYGCIHIIPEPAPVPTVAIKITDVVQYGDDHSSAFITTSIAPAVQNKQVATWSLAVNCGAGVSLIVPGKNDNLGQNMCGSQTKFDSSNYYDISQGATLLTAGATNTSKVASTVSFALYAYDAKGRSVGVSKDAVSLSVPASVPTSQPVLRLISPNGRETWTIGSKVSVSWSAENLTGPLSAYLMPGGSEVRCYLGDASVGFGSATFPLQAPIKCSDNNILKPGQYKLALFADNNNPKADWAATAFSDGYINVVSGAQNQPQPSISISGSVNGLSSTDSLKMKVGDTVTISGTPRNLSGRYLTDYTRAWFFDPIFNGACPNSDAGAANSDWFITCTAKTGGTSKFSAEIYKDGQTYRSNTFVVTVLPPTSTPPRPPVCEYPAPPAGCALIKGPDYDPATSCGLVLACNTPTSTLPRPPLNTTPVGNHDVLSCSRVEGWACDPDSSSSSASNIVFYKDKPIGQGGTFVGSVAANLSREAAVGARCGGNSNHGFSYPMPYQMKDAQYHSLYAYAIDDQTQEPALLTSSPRTVICGSATVTPADTANILETGRQLIQRILSGLGW